MKKKVKIEKKVWKEEIRREDMVLFSGILNI